ncbi:DpnII family type II restriction endonuclease [Ureaplasma ceti]|uniref:Type II restriction endonuclease n=1 Tax=Ureaplasma ceti TaxID=3119530 RepID=A0ABP9U6F9_9BACT
MKSKNLKSDKLDNALAEYLDTIQTTNIELDSFVDFDKIRSQMNKISNNLSKLNYLIAGSYEELDKNIERLWSRNPESFALIYDVLAINDIRNKSAIVDNKVYLLEELLQSLEGVKTLIYRSKLADMIVNGNINNFYDYLYGVKVGSDSNTRKNRNGSKNEDDIYDMLVNHYKDNKDIVIETQVNSEIYNILRNDKKRWDFLVINNKNKKKVLLEASFYNSGGSKVSEVCRAYKEIFDNVSVEKDKKNPNLKGINFVWVADGFGMTTIKSALSEVFGYDYICNKNQLLDKVDTLLGLKNTKAKTSKNPKK